MKTYFFNLMLLSSIVSFSQQSNEKDQIQQIIKSALIDFADMKATLKEVSGTDSIYTALVDLSNIKQAEISRIGEGSQVVLTIEIDSSSTSKSKSITKAWRKKMSTFLGKSFVEKELVQNFGESLGGVKGYTFTNSQIRVGVFYTYLHRYDISHAYLTFERTQ